MGPPDNTCTDFTLYGETEGDGHSYDLESLRKALQPHQPRRVLVNTVLLSSDHAHCTDFYVLTDSMLLCSKTLESEDIVYAERTNDFKTGTLFKAMRDASYGKPSQIEHSWEPTQRFAAFARATREPRGTKSVEHLESLRVSDPCISMHGWLDWKELVAKRVESKPYQIHQQALISQGIEDHRRRVAAAAAAAKQPQEKPARRNSGSAYGVLKPKPDPCIFPADLLPREKAPSSGCDRRSKDSVITMMPPSMPPVFEIETVFKAKGVKSQLPEQDSPKSVFGLGQSYELVTSLELGASERTIP